MEKNRIQRKEAVSLADALKMMLEDAHMTASHNTRRIFEAWDTASGASRYTLKRFFRDGKLYITVDSSVVRSQLSFQKDALLAKINSLLGEDQLVISGDKATVTVKELILK